MRVEEELLDLEELLEDDQDEEAEHTPSRLAIFATDAIVFVLFMAILIAGVLAVGV